jgi:EAL domain-containing protein (putative c-di-GMP-specific phosphodiesterase class I)
MRALADLAHALHLKVCAAGVETRQMLESVRAAGFDSAQGHFFSDAVQAEEIERLVPIWPSFGPGATGSWRVRTVLP